MYERSSKHRRKKTTARRSRVSVSASRRLRLEGMEGRLMLADTAVDFAPLDLAIKQFDLEIAPPAASVGLTLAGAAGSHGGLIQMNYSGAIRENASLDASWPSVRPIALPDDVNSIPIIADWTQSSTVDSFEPAPPAENGIDGQEYDGSPLDVNLETPTEVFVDGPHVNGFELQPSVIPIWETSPQGPALDSSFVRFQQQVLSGDEGGLIPIESVLVSKSLLAGPEFHDFAADSFAESDSDDADEPLRVAAASPSGAISGELARAMAFELAGGEPEDSDSAAGSDRQSGDPTSDTNSQRAEPVSAAAQRDIAQIVSAARMHGKIEAAQAASVLGLLDGFLPVQLVVHRVVEQRLASSAGAVTETNAAMPDITSLESAHTLALEELAADEAAARASLGLEFSLRGALNATPLLMILALERIAASNSRRGNRDERAPTSLTLRRA